MLCKSDKPSIIIIIIKLVSYILLSLLFFSQAYLSTLVFITNINDDDYRNIQ